MKQIIFFYSKIHILIDKKGKLPYKSTRAQSTYNFLRFTGEFSCSVILCCWQCTALIAAASRGRVKVLRLLLDRGADLGMTNTNGKLCLEAAISNGHQDVCMEIIKHDRCLIIVDRFNCAVRNDFIGLVHTSDKNGIGIGVGIWRIFWPSVNQYDGSRNGSLAFVQNGGRPLFSVLNLT